MVLADQYNWLSTGEVLDKIDHLAKGFEALGIKKGDKVIIYADTQARWFYSCLAIAKLGGIVVTLFSNLGETGVRYGMSQTKAEYVITTEELKNGLLAFAHKLPHMSTIVYIPGPQKNGPNRVAGLDAKPTINLDKVKPTREGMTIKTLDEVEMLGKAAVTAGNTHFSLPSPDDMAVIMYTSGTTSLPKAVMLTHKQVMANIKAMTVAALDSDFDVPSRVLASFLPLSHIFGFVFNLNIFISK